MSSATTAYPTNENWARARYVVDSSSFLLPCTVLYRLLSRFAFVVLLLCACWCEAFVVLHVGMKRNQWRGVGGIGESRGGLEIGWERSRCLERPDALVLRRAREHGVGTMMIRMMSQDSAQLREER